MLSKIDCIARGVQGLISGVKNFYSVHRASLCCSPFPHLLCWSSFHSNNLFKFSRGVTGMIFCLLLLNNSGKWSLLEILFCPLCLDRAWQGHSAILGKAVCSTELLVHDEDPSWAAHCCNLLDLIQVVFHSLLTQATVFLWKEGAGQMLKKKEKRKSSKNDEKLLQVLKTESQ